MKRKLIYLIVILFICLFVIKLQISNKVQAACDCWSDVTIVDCAITFFGGSEEGCYEVAPEECDGTCLNTIGCTQSDQTSLILFNPSSSGKMPDTILTGGCGWKVDNLTCSWGEKTANPFDPSELVCRCSGDITNNPCDRITSYKNCP